MFSLLGTSHEELISAHPSRFIMNASTQQTSTQQLGLACSRSQRISALKVPSARNALVYCFNILLDSLVESEYILILDSTERLKQKFEDDAGSRHVRWLVLFHAKYAAIST